MAKTKLPDKERYCLQRVSAYIAKHGKPPTQFEVGLMLDTTQQRANTILANLETKGFITRSAVNGIAILREA